MSRLFQSVAGNVSQELGGICLLRTWKKRGTLAVLFLLISTFICGCGLAGRVHVQGEAEGTGKLKVVTTLFPYYDFTRQIAGDAVELTMVIPAGMDSHSFEPTPADMRLIQEADLLICNGGAMELWVSQVLEAIDAPQLQVVTMMDYIEAVEEVVVEGMEHSGHSHEHDESCGLEPEYEHDESCGLEPEHEHDELCEIAAEHVHEEEVHNHQWTDDDGHHVEIEYDEHIWTSPVNAMKFTEVIADTLIQMDPANRSRYENGRDACLRELEQIHQGFLDVAAKRQRNMIIVGDKFPFRYLADEYGFFYRAAFSGCSTDTEPSARTIAYLIDKVREEGIPAVYYLELSSHRVTEIIGEETGAEPLLLHSCHNVTRREFDAGITYVELMRQNIENIRKGLVE